MSRMRNLSRAGVVLCVGWLLLVCALPLSGQQAAVASTTSSTAVVPPLVSFSGTLTDLNGKSLTGVVGVTFALYSEQSGGAPLWLETQNVYPDKTGHYTVLLGSTTSSGLPPDLFVAGEARWLGVQVQGQAEQSRVSLLSVPYALKAADAQTVGGLPASAFVLAAPPNVNATSAASTSEVVQPMATGTTPVTTAGGTVNKLAKFDAAADITSSQIFDNGTSVGIGNTAPATKLDVSGGATVRGLLTLPAAGTATATTSYDSQAIKLTASAYNSGTAAAVNQNFRLQAEPTGNDTASPSGTLNFLFGSGTATPAETGLKIASNGRITFAAGQTFPGTGTGNGSVTSVGSGLGLTGGPITTSGTLAINTAVVPQLKANNTFTGTQSITGSLGINTTAPTQSLEVDSGNAIIRGAGNFKGTGNTATLYIGDTSHPIEAIYSGGVAIGAFKAPSALFIADFTGNVGIGTTTPTTGILNTAANTKSVVGLSAVGWNATILSGLSGTDAIHATGGNGDVSDYGTDNGGTGVLATGGSGNNPGPGMIAVGGGGGGDGVDATGGYQEGTGVWGMGGLSDNAGYAGYGVIAGGNGSNGLLAVVIYPGQDAGEFEGNVEIQGNLSVTGTKSFKIDHPLDPANKYLYHAALESSEVLDLYSGNATLDAAGEATVQLPDWFEALNTDFRYQLTAIGAAAPNLHIAQKIQSNRFKIAGGSAGMEVSWQVTGARHDAWEKANPMAVEVEKPPRERGYYINPELFGAPPERSIQWARNPKLMQRMKHAEEEQAKRMQTMLAKPRKSAKP